MIKAIFRRRVFYIATGFLLGIVLFGSYLMMSDDKACASKDSVSKAYVSSLLDVQRDRHNAYGKFADSLSQLSLYAPGILDELQKRIFSDVPFAMWEATVKSERNVFTIFLSAREKKYSEHFLYSQIGRIVYNEERKTYVKLICKSEKPGSLDSQAFTISSSKPLGCPISTRKDC